MRVIQRDRLPLFRLGQFDDEAFEPHRTIVDGRAEECALDRKFISRRLAPACACAALTVASSATKTDQRLNIVQMVVHGSWITHDAAIDPPPRRRRGIATIAVLLSAVPVHAR